jgi:putative transposase
LKRFQESGHSHFVTFSCYHRRPLFTSDPAKRVFEAALERVRRTFRLCVYGYVVMPEHVHLLVSEPERGVLADALKSLKQSVSRRLVGNAEHFWQKRYYDFNVRNYLQFVEKLRYIHRNPVKRGLCGRPEDWEWSAFVNTQQGAKDEWRLSASGRQEGASERQGRSVQPWNCPTQAKRGLEWGTRQLRITGDGEMKRG